MKKGEKFELVFRKISLKHTLEERRGREAWFVVFSVANAVPNHSWALSFFGHENWENENYKLIYSEKYSVESPVQ